MSSPFHTITTQLAYYDDATAIRMERGVPCASECPSHTHLSTLRMPMAKTLHSASWMYVLGHIKSIPIYVLFEHAKNLF